MRSAKLLPLLVSALVVLLGVAAAFHNRDLPPVRHSVLAIQTTFAILDQSLSSHLTWGKPLGLSLLNLPFLKVLGPQAGFLACSLLSTLLLLGMIWLWHRQLAGRAPSGAFLLLTVYNPLFVYQFWSLGPDAAGSAFFLASFCLLHRWLNEPKPAPWVVAGYFLTLYAALLMRTHALLLPLFHLAYAWGARMDGASLAPLCRWKAWPFVLGYALYGALVALGRMGLNITLLNLAPGADSGVDEYVGSYALNLLELGLFALISYSFCAWLLLKPAPRPLARGRLALPALAFLASAIVYKYTYHNLRYFLPISPFLALWIAQALESLPGRFRQGLLAAAFGFSSLGIYLTNFEHDPARLQLLREHYPLDNFRLPSRLAHRAALQLLEPELRQGRRACIVTRYYGGEVYAGFFERTGYLPAGSNLTYATDLAHVAETAGPDPFTLWYIDHDAIDVAASVRRAFAGREIEPLGYDVFRIRGSTSISKP